MKYLKWTLLALMAVLVSVSLTSCEWLFDAGTEVRTYNESGSSILNGINQWNISVGDAGEIREVEAVILNGLDSDSIAANQYDITIQTPGALVIDLANSSHTGSFDGNYTFVDPGTDGAVNNFVGDPIPSASYWADEDFGQMNGKDTLGNWRVQINNSSLTAGSLSNIQLRIRYEPY